MSSGQISFFIKNPHVIISLIAVAICGTDYIFLYRKTIGKEIERQDIKQNM